MANVCSICVRADRLEIDREIVQGEALVRIARKFSVGYHSLHTHATNHVTRQLTQAWEKKELEGNFDLLNRVDIIIRRAEDIFKRNYDKGADSTALKALDSQRNTIELLAKISYSLHQARIAELEIAKQQQGEPDQELEEMLMRQLNILTYTELDLWNQLAVKLQTQDKTLVIKQNPPPTIFPDAEKTRMRRQSTPPTQTVTPEAKNEPDPTPDDWQGIKPIPPVALESTPWEENPLNPRTKMQSGYIRTK